MNELTPDENGKTVTLKTAINVEFEVSKVFLSNINNSPTIKEIFYQDFKEAIKRNTTEKKLKEAFENMLSKHQL